MNLGSFYLVTDTRMCGGPDGVVRTVEAAIAHGVSVVQVRDPDASREEFANLACAVVERVAGRVPVLLNDRVDLVEETGADGAHIGQTDMHPTGARALIGPSRILGLSTQTIEHIDAANALEQGTLDYLGVGPVWEQSTKLVTIPARGPEFISEVVHRSRLPIYAIGGIRMGRVAAIRATGAAGFCVVSAVCAASDPADAAEALRVEWDGATSEGASHE